MTKTSILFSTVVLCAVFVVVSGCEDDDDSSNVSQAEAIETLCNYIEQACEQYPSRLSCSEANPLAPESEGCNDVQYSEENVSSECIDSLDSIESHLSSPNWWDELSMDGGISWALNECLEI